MVCKKFTEIEMSDLWARDANKREKKRHCSVCWSQKLRQDAIDENKVLFEGAVLVDAEWYDMAELVLEKGGKQYRIKRDPYNGLLWGRE